MIPNKHNSYRVIAKVYPRRPGTVANRTSLAASLHRHVSLLDTYVPYRLRFCAAKNDLGRAKLLLSRGVLFLTTEATEVTELGCCSGTARREPSPPRVVGRFGECRRWYKRGGAARFAERNATIRLTSGGRSWDGETVIRTLADRTRTFRFAGSQASADSSFSPHAKAQRRQDEVLGK